VRTLDHRHAAATAVDAATDAATPAAALSTTLTAAAAASLIAAATAANGAADPSPTAANATAQPYAGAAGVRSASAWPRAPPQPSRLLALPQLRLWLLSGHLVLVQLPERIHPPWRQLAVVYGHVLLRRPA
jgi:hypothetical protein